MDTLKFIEKLEKWINCNEFTQHSINKDYQAVDAEKLKGWLYAQREQITNKDQTK